MTLTDTILGSGAAQGDPTNYAPQSSDFANFPGVDQSGQAIDPSGGLPPADFVARIQALHKTQSWLPLQTLVGYAASGLSDSEIIQLGEQTRQAALSSVRGQCNTYLPTNAVSTPSM